jgi:predicted esterase
MFPFTTENEQSTQTPILISHGTHDDRIPWQFAESTYVKLKQTHKGPLITEIVEGVTHALSLRSFELMKQFVK